MRIIFYKEISDNFKCILWIMLSMVAAYTAPKTIIFFGESGGGYAALFCWSITISIILYSGEKHLKAILKTG